ncbi:MAG: tyrosine-protein phosphatase [Treponema sp.]|jgi:protein-tyrosine phosphatase|nr:tyrosine-protein phosphatase [Treponema sp.]
MHHHRILPLEGVLNVRELGGYPVVDAGGQKQVAWGLLYRSGDLEGIAPAGKRCLEQRNITTIVDFRSEKEKQIFPGIQLSTVTMRRELPIDAGNLMGALSPGGQWLFNPDSSGAVEEMLRLYALLPREAVPRYREFFAILSDPANAPLLFHCSAGKDRTGLAAALVLHALGVSRETIIADYLLSAECLRSRYLPYAEAKPSMVPYMTVREEYLLTAFREIDNYGGLDRYLTRELKADTAHLRRLYTVNR